MRADWYDDRLSVLAPYRFACARCGYEDPRGALELHHRLPRGRGGRDDWPNRVPLCDDCHNWVHREDPDEATRIGLLIPSWAGMPTVPFGNPSR